MYMYMYLSVTERIICCTPTCELLNAAERRKNCAISDSNTELYSGESEPWKISKVSENRKYLAIQTFTSMKKARKKWRQLDHKRSFMHTTLSKKCS